MTTSIFTLFVVEPAAKIFQVALDLCAIAGLPVTSWRDGDPELTIIDHQSEFLEALGQKDAEFIKGGFISSAGEDWGEVHASEVYGIERGAASPSTPTVTLHNTGGGFYPLEAGELVVKSSISNVTFHNTVAHNTVGDQLSAGAEVTFELVADVDGSVGTVDVDEIDTIVSPALLGCSITGSTRAVGTDKQSLVSLKQDCLDSLGALSPNGPADAYEFVVRQPELTGVETITRSRSTNDSDTGEVTVYLAGPSGGVDGPTVTAAQNAIDKWAAPLALADAVAATAINQTVNITVTVNRSGVTGAVTLALQNRFKTFQIADEDGAIVGRDALYQAIRNALDPTAADNDLLVSLTVPVGDTPYAEGFVPVPGVITVTEVP